METISTLPDGARLIRNGDGHAGCTVLFFGRLNFAADGALRKMVTDLFRENGFGFVIYEPPYEAARRRSSPNGKLPAVRGLLRGLPRPLRDLLRRVWMLAHPAMWRFVTPGARQKCESVPFCVDSFVRAARTLDGQRLILVGRSHGARVVSLVAEELGAAGLVCFSYPFRHPQEDEDASRTAHLAGLRRPCLIFQGDHDEYGGRESVGRYRLSPSIELQLVPAGHSFAISDSEWHAVFDRMLRFIREKAAVSAGNGASR